eukprot:3914748-Prymnesium_polylepis.1
MTLPCSFKKLEGSIWTEGSNLLSITSYTPTTGALAGAKTTRLPTAAAPKNFLSRKSPVEMESSNVPVTTSYTPTTFATTGAKITRFPTAAAPANFSAYMLRLPVGTEASNACIGRFQAEREWTCGVYPDLFGGPGGHPDFF